MPISYKHKIYTTLGTPTVLSGDVVSATDNAGVPAKDYTVKGKTIVWNQLFDKNSIPNRNSTAITYGVDGNINILTTTNVIATSFFSFLCPTVSGHKYMICARSLEWNSPNHSNLFIGDSGHPDTASYATLTPIDLAKTFTATNEICYIKSYISYSAGNYEFKMNGLQLFDLTQMFGAGNEPATPEEFRAMFPDDYYSYNAGELKTIVPTSIQASGVERFQLLDKSKYPATTTTSGVTFTNNGDGTITANGTAGSTVNIWHRLKNDTEIPIGHKVLISGGVTGAGWSSYLFYDDSDATYGIDSPGGGKIYTVKFSPVKPMIFIAKGYTVSNLVFKPQLFDLTEMFGAGNEPATPAEFWQKVPEKLYGYNPSAYRAVNIPSSKYFPDGMRSAGSAYDEINFLSQKAIKRIGAVDMGTLNWSSNPGTYPTNSFYSVDFHDAKGDTRNIISNGKFNNIYANNGGMIIAITDSDEKYDSNAAFKAAMSGVMLYYELATPVETAITPSLQALSTFNGFTSFSAPNSLMQNGPLSVTYYAEGGANPESGWLTSYKRKLYMGRNIEWNQLFTNSRTGGGTLTFQNQNGIITINGTSSISYFNFDELSDAMNQTHSYLLYLKILNNPDNVSLYYGWFNRGYMRTETISSGETCIIVAQSDSYIPLGKSTGLSGFTDGTVFNNVKVAVMVVDLTQMFGAGNEPATPAEFWSYFDHKLYPYNAGETQPLFKISRKSQWGSNI